MPNQPCILFTAFEPSGDEHAAPIIRKLRWLAPSVPIYALGGSKMEAAGAKLIERTTDDAAMLSGAIGKAWWHRKLMQRLEAWMADHPVRVHVPTDSPAANWAICKMVKRLWGSDSAALPGGAERARDAPRQAPGPPLSSPPWPAAPTISSGSTSR